MSYSKQHEATILEMVRPIDIRDIEASAIFAALNFFRPILRLCHLQGNNSLNDQLSEAVITVRDSLNEVLRSYYLLDISNNEIYQELEELENIANRKKSDNDQDIAILRTYVLLHRPPEILASENPELFNLISKYL